MFRENVTVKGVVTHRLSEEEPRSGEGIYDYIDRIERDGKVVEKQIYSIPTKNLVTTVGLNWLCDRAIGAANVYQGDTASGLMGWGIDSTVAAVGNGSLFDEVWRDKFTSATRSSNVISWAAFMPKTGSGNNEAGTIVPNGSTLREVAMFVKGNSAAGDLQTPSWTADTGAAINRAVYAAIAKTSTLALVTEIDWTLS